MGRAQHARNLPGLPPPPSMTQNDTIGAQQTVFPNLLK
jgi:hypothetical protein